MHNTNECCVIWHSLGGDKSYSAIPPHDSAPSPPYAIPDSPPQLPAKKIQTVNVNSHVVEELVD